MLPYFRAIWFTWPKNGLFAEVPSAQADAKWLGTINPLYRSRSQFGGKPTFRQCDLLRVVVVRVCSGMLRKSQC
jgi:hypothetical protein